jgi:hypothetical protein
VPAVPEKTVALVGAEPVERGQPLGCQRAGDQGASPTPADGSDAASLPRALDEEPLWVGIPLVQVRTYLRSTNMKRPANKLH